MDILSLESMSGNDSLRIILLSFAVLRIYLEIIGFRFEKLPLTANLIGRGDISRSLRFHRMGLIFSVGYILFEAPVLLLS